MSEQKREIAFHSFFFFFFNQYTCHTMYRMLWRYNSCLGVEANSAGLHNFYALEIIDVSEGEMELQT